MAAQKKNWQTHVQWGTSILIAHNCSNSIDKKFGSKQIFYIFEVKSIFF